jgi:hypothetical protein
MASQRFDIRLAGGTAEGPRSSVWAFWSRKSEVYAAVAQMGGIEKFSFHTPNLCRRAFTKEHGTPSTLPNRATLECRRDPTPALGSNQVVRVLRVGFATDLLSTALQHPRHNPIWIAPAPLGGSTVVELVFARESLAAVVAALATDAPHFAHKLVAYKQLPNGEAFYITSWYAEQADKVLRMPADAGHKDDLIVFPHDINQSGRPVRLSLFSNPKDGDFIQVWELGAFWHPPLTDAEWDGMCAPYHALPAGQPSFAIAAPNTVPLTNSTLGKITNTNATKPDSEVTKAGEKPGNDENYQLSH